MIIGFVREEGAYIQSFDVDEYHDMRQKVGRVMMISYIRLSDGCQLQSNAAEKGWSLQTGTVKARCPA